MTSPPVSTRPPPGGFDSIIFPAAISSSKRFSIMTLVSPSGVRAEIASSYEAPTVDGTTIREPGPTSVYQPPMPSAIARTRATLRLRRTRLLARCFFSSRRRISLVLSLISILGSTTISCFALVRDFSRMASTGRSSSNFIWFFLGSKSAAIASRELRNSPASRGRLSGSLLVARLIRSSSACGISLRLERGGGIS